LAESGESLDDALQEKLSRLEKDNQRLRAQADKLVEVQIELENAKQELTNTSE
jgi:hypothetical protein